MLIYLKLADHIRVYYTQANVFEKLAPSIPHLAFVA